MQLQYLLNLQDSKVNVKLHYHADPRPMLVFLSLFSHWLSNDHTMGQLKWWHKEKKGTGQHVKWQLNILQTSIF